MPASYGVGEGWRRKLAPLAFALAAGAAVASGGCRVFRCQRVSDESVAAARQLSLAGLDAQQRGQWERAESLFAAAILKCPADERARCGFAEALWHRGAQAEAISHMQEAVRLSGHDPERLVRLGQMYAARGDINLASHHADLAIAANPALASAWALRGQVCRAHGNADEALASFHRALSCQQPLPEVQLAISEIYLQQGRPQRALATIQALSATYPLGRAPANVLVHEADALRALNRQQEAARLLAQAEAGSRQDEAVALASASTLPPRSPSPLPGPMPRPIAPAQWQSTSQTR
jgi:tetratricopeptide (TPR) repeat protein